MDGPKHDLMKSALMDPKQTLYQANLSTALLCALAPQANSDGQSILAVDRELVLLPT